MSLSKSEEWWRVNWKEKFIKICNNLQIFHFHNERQRRSQLKMRGISQVIEVNILLSIHTLVFEKKNVTSLIINSFSQHVFFHSIIDWPICILFHCIKKSLHWNELKKYMYNNSQRVSGKTFTFLFMSAKTTTKLFNFYFSFVFWKKNEKLRILRSYTLSNLLLLLLMHVIVR